MDLSNSALAQSIGESRREAENYLAYISRQGDEQSDNMDTMKSTLDDVVKEVWRSGTVSAFAAQEAVQSHNTIFAALGAMTKTQNYLTKLVVEVKQNGGNGTGGSILGSMVKGAITASTTAVTLTGGGAIPAWPYIAAAGAVVSGFTEAVSQRDKWAANQAELNLPHSPVRQALDAASDAQKLTESVISGSNGSFTNDPSMPKKGVSLKDFPYTRTAGEAMAVVAAINEANGEHGNQMRHNGMASDEMTYGLNTEYDHLMRYNGQAAAALMPQAAQVIVQTAPPSEPEQPINITMNNTFKIPSTDPDALRSLSQSLGDLVMEEFSRRGLRSTRS